MNESVSIKHRAEYLAVRAVLFLLRIPPAGLALVLGEALGGLFFEMDRRHQRVALDNLRIAFGREKSDSQLKQVARGSYRHLGRSLVELARADRCTGEQLMESIRIEGLDHFLEAHKRGKGVLYLTAHLGNWEMMALAQSLKGYPMGVVARPTANPLLDRLLVKLRTRWGNRVIQKGGAIRESIRRLRSGETLGFLLDQNAAPEQGVFVNFFGRPACTHKTLALLAMKTGAAVLPAFTYRRSDGGHQIIIEPPVPLVDTGHPERDVVTNTQSLTSIIERYVRSHPEQWLWVHRRWKSQPKLD